MLTVRATLATWMATLDLLHQQEMALSGQTMHPDRKDIRLQAEALRAGFWRVCTLVLLLTLAVAMAYPLFFSCGEAKIAQFCLGAICVPSNGTITVESQTATISINAVTVPDRCSTKLTWYFDEQFLGYPDPYGLKTLDISNINPGEKKKLCVALDSARNEQYCVDIGKE